MLKIFRYLKKEWRSVLIILVLLVIQATCDLALPQYTSDIVNTGITKYGIENSVPEVVSEAKYNTLKIFLNEEQSNLLDNSYQKTDAYKQPAYELKTKDKETLKNLDQDLKQSIMVIYTMESSGQYDLKSLAAMPKEAKQQILDEVTDAMNKMGDKTADTVIAQFIISEKKALDIDINKQQTGYIVATGSKMLLVALIAMVCSITAALFASRSAARIGMNLRIRVFRNVVNFSGAEMDQFSTASLITRTTNDIQQIQLVTVMMLRMVLYAPIIGIGGIIKVLRTESSMAWIIAAAVGVLLMIILVLLVVAMPKFKIVQRLVDRVNLVAREILTGLPVIRAFSREKYEEKRFDKANTELTKVQLFTSRVMSCMMPLMMFVMNGVSVAIIWFGGKGIDAGSLQVGDMMAFITYTMQIIMAFLLITLISVMFPRAAVSAGRIDEVIAVQTTIKEPESPKEAPKKGVLSFEHVSFSYPNASDKVLDDISFTVKPGQTTAIIGSTGSGKSTLVNLVPRLYDVTEGKITIDNIDIRDLSLHDLRGLIGFVPQKTVLFSGTIASNLRFGNENATDEEVMRAAEIAQAEEFIKEKYEKYDSPIAQGGSNVSGGQRQRLSIARAIAKKPKIFVFDDSFSALDNKTDAVLRKALKENVQDAAVIIVAQKIGTILHADQIIVMDEGKIAGIGTHEELLKQNEVYRQIAGSQLSEQDFDAVFQQDDPKQED